MQKLQLSDYANYLKPRVREWHKGMSGHVVIVGGELGYSGAPRMAAEAALRVGAGLVSVATQPVNAVIMNACRPEIMCHGVENIEQLKPLIEKANVIVLGPGLGQTAWSKALWDYVCEQKLPLVVDADALNLLAVNHKTNDNWVLTPHPGEAARLLNQTVEKIQQDRPAAIQDINKRFGGVCVLKGARSVVFSIQSHLAVCEQGNPGMASAGMGDVLSGVIGGLIAQGIPLVDATKLGVLIHAMAGDLAAKDGERGMVASDLMPYLRKLVNL